MKKIVVIGIGYVGLTTALIFADVGYEVICIDKNKQKIKLLKNKKMPFYEKMCNELLIKNYNKLSFETDYNKICNFDLFFVCVGTPLIKNKNTLDLNGIIEACQLIRKNVKVNKDVTICIRSTILPGTCKKIEFFINEPNIHVIHNPEFLSQGSAIYDSINASRVVIGSNNNISTKVICDIYDTFLQKNNKKTPILVMEREEAEMVKFVANSYLAMRISFINDISNLCEKLNINITEIINGIKYDDRIGGHYLKCGIGYGGSCLPKDTRAIVNFSDTIHSPLNLIREVIKINDKQAEKCFNRIKQDFPNLLNKNIAILGVSFKAGTDDIRNACSIYIIDKLLKDKANISVFDPCALNSIKKKYKEKIKYYTNIDDCIKNCSVIIITTEWDEIIKYNYNKMIFDDKIFIYDFKTCLNKKEIVNSKIKYWSVGGNNE